MNYPGHTLYNVRSISFPFASRDNLVYHKHIIVVVCRSPSPTIRVHSESSRAYTLHPGTQVYTPPESIADSQIPGRISHVLPPRRTRQRSHATVTGGDRLEVVGTGVGGERELGRGFIWCGV